MLVHQAFRYELAPTAAQRAALTNHAGAARWAWNWGLAVRRKAWQRRRQTILGSEQLALERERLAIGGIERDRAVDGDTRSRRIA